MDFELSGIRKAAMAFWQSAGDQSVFAFHGAIGSGKTTFIHALCETKNVKDQVGSPTFSIVNEYLYLENGIEKKIFHIDLYRLKDESEAMLAGVEECLESGQICLVEWPERAPGLFPENTVHVYMKLIDDRSRSLQIGNN